MQSLLLPLWRGRGGVRAANEPDVLPACSLPCLAAHLEAARELECARQVFVSMWKLTNLTLSWKGQIIERIKIKKEKKKTRKKKRENKKERTGRAKRKYFKGP